ncbi:MAG: outer membrane lipoprotein-sorting protein [Chloroherpetonaceae bacterium]|nr:outer membrane lipoprotein-sorting protein [Chloroherpetonaceae bacterium]
MVPTTTCRIVRCVLLTALLMIYSAIHPDAARQQEIRDIRELIPPLQDLEATIRVTRMEARELEKIGGDFTTNYSVLRNLRTLSLLYKSPDKLLLEGRSSVLGEAALVIVGPVRFYAVSKLNLRRRENLEKEPARRQSLLEYSGLLSEDTLRYMRVKAARQDALDGAPVLVYDLVYRASSSSSYYRLWIDPHTRIVRQRDWYDTEHRLRATFRYEEPREVSEGIYVPGRCDIINPDGVIAGSMTYTDLKVNQGIPDALFDVSR